MGRLSHSRAEAIASLKARLDAGSKRVGACLVWQGKTSGANAYGSIDFPRRFADFFGMTTSGTTRWIPIAVSRARMALKLGGLRPAQKVLHRCDNQLCSAKAHLFFGTQAENMRDKVAKGRQAQGEQIAQAKLTKQQAWEIRQFWNTGLMTQAEIARHYAVSSSNVSRIVNRITRRVA